MGKINVLSFAVANLIAAGEVVDRPSSVIKELLENAIDSGADRISVEIQNGGVTYMRVSDNGCGISPEDLPVAIRRHATSKIKDAEDLDSIMTLGFRGEALAAIASVSDLRIISKLSYRKNLWKSWRIPSVPRPVSAKSWSFPMAGKWLWMGFNQVVLAPEDWPHLQVRLAVFRLFRWGWQTVGLTRRLFCSQRAQRAQH